MTDRPLISATLIAKDEKLNVRRCFDSIWPYVDEVVVCDTGSTDGTIAELRRYAKQKRQTAKLKIVRHKWTDDFAAARQTADDAATGEWVLWLDFDDTINGMERLRQMVEAATEDVVGFFARYSYARDQDGNTVSELWRERIVRNDGNRWLGRLHEHKIFTHGGIVQVDPTIAEWIHHRDHEQRTGERNLRILHSWLEDEPDDPRVVHSIAMEYMGAQRHKDAADMFARYLACDGEEPDRRAQAFRHMCTMLMIDGRPAEARAAAFQAAQENWLWADTHLTLAEAEQTLGRPDIGLSHAREALQIGKPDTLLIINPLHYSAHPRAVMSVCLAQMGRVDEAIELCQEALAIAPHYPLAEGQLPQMLAHQRRERAVMSVIASSQMLEETGELLKARTLLDQAPWYVFNDARIVQKRGEISLLIEERIAAPKVAVADEAADAFIERHMEAA